MAVAKHEKKEPLLRLAARDDMKAGKRWAIRIASILVALILGAVLFISLGYSPFSVYGAMIKGSLGGKLAIQQTIKIAIPLLGASLAIAPAFRMKFWNIGVEGQITMGGIFATFFALNFYDSWPSWLLILVMCIAGAVGGAIWGLIPAVFRAKWGTNETLFTLMMNYVAIQLTSYFVALWENPVGSNTVGVINQRTKDGWFPELFGQEYGLNVVLVLLLTVGMFLYLKYSKQGYEISVVGDSENTARYAGINVKKVTIRTMAISGAICGLAGFIAVAGASHTISTSTAGGRGFTAIIVAWLAQFNTFVMILISFLLVFLQKGAIQIASQFNLNDYASNIITGIILFFILGSEFFINYRIILRGGKEGAK